jgi:hypothetical protein
MLKMISEIVDYDEITGNKVILSDVCDGVGFQKSDSGTGSVWKDDGNEKIPFLRRLEGEKVVRRVGAGCENENSVVRRIDLGIEEIGDVQKGKK